MITLESLNHHLYLMKERLKATYLNITLLERQAETIDEEISYLEGFLQKQTTAQPPPNTPP